MWLGLSALFAALSFAMAKFLTALHMRRLEDERIRLQYEVKRAHQHVDSLQGKLQVAQANLGSTQNKVERARRFKNDMFSRLLMGLPSHMQTRLHQCISSHPVPEPRGIKVYHQLRISDRISAALGAVSIIVLDLPDDGDPGQATLVGNLVRVLEEGDVSYTRTERRDEDDVESIVCGFDDPNAALQIARQLASTSAPEHLAHLRGVLLAAVGLGDGADDDSPRLSFARSLDLAQHLMTTAPMGTLLINEPAFAAISDRTGIEPSTTTEKIYVYKWQMEESPQAGEPPEAEAGAPGDQVEAKT